MHNSTVYEYFCFLAVNVLKTETVPERVGAK